jgi:hypothetical protein
VIALLTLLDAALVACHVCSAHTVLIMFGTVTTVESTFEQLIPHSGRFDFGGVWCLMMGRGFR